MLDTANPLVESLNPAQAEAVTSEAKYCRVLAGAGSGKTRVLVHRMAWLMSEKGVSPNRILAVTFTNKAAGEMKKRIEELLNIPTYTMWVGTFHGLAHRILRQYHQEAGLPSNFQIMDSDDQHRLLKRLIKESGYDEDDIDSRRLQGFVNKQKDEGRRHRHLGAGLNTEQMQMGELYRVYEEHCQRSGLVDFAELLLRVWELWKGNPDVLSQFHQLFTHVLVDEFQDTNTIQYQWLQMVCSPECSVTIVGDDDQSIYGWRGAKIENIHRFAKDFPNSHTIRLEQNYRSTGSILSAANALIQNNEERLGKELWTDSGDGDKITLYGAFNELDEARFIVERIKHWLNEDGSAEEVAILYRSNAQSRVLEQALRANQLPYKIYGGLRFFDRAEIKDAVAYLRLLANVNDDPAFERVVNMPPRGIGERTMATIRQKANENQTSLWQAAHDVMSTLNPGRTTKGLNDFFDIIAHLVNQAKEIEFGPLLQETLTVSGLTAYIKGQPGEKTFTKLENLQELITASSQYASDYMHEHDAPGAKGDDVLVQFLSDIALDAGEKEGEQDERSIKLMTLHAAKGLEFPLVFMAGLEEGLFPHHRCANVQDLLEEERRLCYVGITRAMKKLFITYAQKRTFAGSSGLSAPSRFINEIPGKLIETLKLNGHITPPQSSRFAPRRQSTQQQSFADNAPGVPYKIGQQVSHPKFGNGVVLGSEGQGDLARVQVNFEGVGPKWLVVSYAKLTTA